MPAPASSAPADLVDRFLFPAPKPSYTADSWPGELIWIPRHGARGDPAECCEADAAQDLIPCLLMLSRAARFFVLCLHANGDDLGRFYGFCNRLRQGASVHVLAVEYPGYGICPGGQATGAAVTANALAGLRFLREDLRWPIDSIIVFGRSVGCGPALAIAAGQPLRGLILVSPFLSVGALVRDYIPLLADLISERFPNREVMKQVTAPLLLVHGKKDQMISCDHGQALFELCMSRKHLVTPEEMRHNTNLHSDLSFLVFPMLTFFSLLPPSYREVHVPAAVFRKPRLPRPVDIASCLGPHCCLQVEAPSVFGYQAVVHRLPTPSDPLKEANASPSRIRVRPKLPLQLAGSEVLPAPSHDTIFRTVAYTQVNEGLSYAFLEHGSPGSLASQSPTERPELSNNPDSEEEIYDTHFGRQPSTPRQGRGAAVVSATISARPRAPIVSLDLALCGLSALPPHPPGSEMWSPSGFSEASSVPTPRGARQDAREFRSSSRSAACKELPLTSVSATPGAFTCTLAARTEVPGVGWVTELPPVVGSPRSI